MASARDFDSAVGAMTSIRMVVSATSGNLRVAPMLMEDVTTMMRRL